MKLYQTRLIGIIVLFTTIAFPNCLVANANAPDTSIYFNEVNGLIVAEIESLNPASGWAEKTDRSGFTGTSFFEWTNSNQLKTPGSGLLSFTIKINTPDTYRFLWRSKVGHGTEPTESNDSWLKIAGANDYYGIKSSGHIVHPHGDCTNDCPNGGGKDGWFKIYSSGTTSWTWSCQTSDNDPHQIYAKFDNPGFYTVLISGRSKNHLLDRFIMYSNTITKNSATNISNKETKVITVTPTSAKVVVSVKDSISAQAIISATQNLNKTMRYSDVNGFCFFYNVPLGKQINLSTSKTNYISKQTNFIPTKDTIIEVLLARETTNVFQHNLNESISIFPNPFSNEIKIESEKTIQSICLKNILGQVLICKNDINNSSTVLNVQAIPTGLYYISLRFKDQTHIQTQQLIKN